MSRYFYSPGSKLATEENSPLCVPLGDRPASPAVRFGVSFGNVSLRRNAETFDRDLAKFIQRGGREHRSIRAGERSRARTFRRATTGGRRAPVLFYVCAPGEGKPKKREKEKSNILLRTSALRIDETNSRRDESLPRKNVTENRSGIARSNRREVSRRQSTR